MVVSTSSMQKVAGMLNMYLIIKIKRIFSDSNGNISRWKSALEGKDRQFLESHFLCASVA